MPGQSGNQGLTNGGSHAFCETAVTPGRRRGAGSEEFRYADLAARAGTQRSQLIEEGDTIVGTIPASASAGRRHPRASRGAAVVLLVALPALSGCAANFGAQTNQPYQPANGTTDRDGDVYAVNVLVVSDEGGDGTMVGTLINQESVDDELTGFTATALDGTQIASAALRAPVDLPPQRSVQLEQEGPLGLGAQTLVPGDFVNVTFTFAKASPVDLQVLVHDDDSIYSAVPISPVPTSAPPS